MLYLALLAELFLRVLPATNGALPLDLRFPAYAPSAALALAEGLSETARSRLLREFLVLDIMFILALGRFLLGLCARLRAGRPARRMALAYILADLAEDGLDAALILGPSPALAWAVAMATPVKFASLVLVAVLLAARLWRDRDTCGRGGDRPGS